MTGILIEKIFQYFLNEFDQILSYRLYLRKKSRSGTLVLWSSFVFAGKLYLILLLRIISGSKEKNATYFLRPPIIRDRQKSTIVINKVPLKFLLLTRCFIYLFIYLFIY